MKTLFVTFAAIGLTTWGLSAQSPSMSCKGQNRGRGSNFCEVRETTVAALPTLNVDGRQNGGISIKGANRSDILVRAMVQAGGNSDSDAKSTGAQVVVNTSAGTVQANGPSSKEWSVSYEIFVPMKTNLNLTANNGGVSVDGVQSSIGFRSVNGGISLKNVGGNVQGETVNGGVSVSLAGASWSGQGLDVKTQNGGVSMKVAEKFSAQLEVETVNGGINVKLPNAPAMQRRDNRINVTLGSGGPLIRVRTHNGGVNISGV